MLRQDTGLLPRPASAPPHPLRRRAFWKSDAVLLASPYVLGALLGLVLGHLFFVVIPALMAR